MYRLLRHTAGSLALLSLLLSAQGGLAAHVLFQIRQDYIAHHLCENRDQPASRCHGMCFLKKRMAEAEQHSRQQTATPVASPVLFFVAAEAETEPVRPVVRQAYTERSERPPLSEYHRLVDRPPRIV